MSLSNPISLYKSHKFSAAILLGQYISVKQPDSIVVIHRDRDYLSEEEIGKLRTKVEKHGFRFYVPSGVDIESEYISHEHINSIYPGISVEKAKSFIDHETELAEQDSLDRLVDSFFKANRPENNGYAKKYSELKSLYVGNKTRYRYGKKVCGHLASLIQQEIGSNPNLFQSSLHLSSECLQQIAGDIWGS